MSRLVIASPGSGVAAIAANKTSTCAGGRRSRPNSFSMRVKRMRRSIITSIGQDADTASLPTCVFSSPAALHVDGTWHSSSLKPVIHRIENLIGRTRRSQPEGHHSVSIFSIPHDTIRKNAVLGQILRMGVVHRANCLVAVHRVRSCAGRVSQRISFSSGRVALLALRWA